MKPGTTITIVLAAFAVTLFGLAMPLVAGESTPVTGQARVWEPGIVTTGTISALDAVKMTLEHQPNIRLQEENTMFRLGLATEATGQFDTTLYGGLSYEYTQSRLTAKEKKAEQKRRDDLADRLDTARNAIEEYQRSLGELNDVRDVWESGGDPGSVGFTDPIAQAQYELLIQMYETAPEDQKDAFRDAILEFLDRQAQAVEEGLAQALETESDLSGKLDRLGDVPDVIQSFNANFNLSLDRQFRSGISISAFYDLTGTGANYKGKKHDVDDGGMGVIDAYTSTLGFRVLIPLGRGRGVESTGARERAAQIDHEASEAALAHAVSFNAYTTLLAYWDVVAAQESLQVLETSLELNRKILETTRTLIDADEIPRSELARTEARVAEVEAGVEAARRRLQTARIALANAIGLELRGEGIAPLASDGFPALPGDDLLRSLSPQPLVSVALERRLDLRASRLLESSGKVLSRAALLDLRRVFDLELEVSASGLGESYAAGTGIKDSLTGDWAGPSGRIALNVDYPFANNIQEGRLAQQEALYRQARISNANLERLIGLNVVEAARTLGEAARQVARYRAAVEAYGRAVETEMERLRLSASTVIDTITTEQRQLTAQLSLVAAEATYARLLARLRYETGTLLTEAGGSGSIAAADLVTPPRVD